MKLAALALATLAAAACASAAPASPRIEGFNFPCWWQDCYATAAASRSLTGLARTGAGWAALTPTWFVRSAGDSRIRRTPSTVDDDALRAAMRQARGLGLSVALKPHVDIVDGSFRGSIEPADEALWWSDYREMILHYARIAAEEKAGLFVVGTELARQAVPPRKAQWEALIAEVRRIYPGPLTYAANFYDFTAVPFWRELDYVGIDGYFPAPGGANVSLLRAGLSAYLPLVWSVSKLAGKPVLFTEFGIASQKGASLRPWNYGSFGRVDMAEQAAYIRAFLETFAARSWCAGFFYWAWEADPDAGGPASPTMTVQGKPGQKVLERWFARGRAPVPVAHLDARKAAARIDAVVSSVRW